MDASTRCLRSSSTVEGTPSGQDELSPFSPIIQWSISKKCDKRRSKRKYWLVFVYVCEEEIEREKEKERQREKEKKREKKREKDK